MYHSIQKRSVQITPTKIRNFYNAFFSLVVKDGIPENDDLAHLAIEIALKWRELGRRLLKKDAPTDMLYAVSRTPFAKPFEKAYDTLLKWKALKGSDATFQALYGALCHRSVSRRDLAQKYCLVE